MTRRNGRRLWLGDLQLIISLLSERYTVPCRFSTNDFERTNGRFRFRRLPDERANDRSKFHTAGSAACHRRCLWGRGAAAFGQILSNRFFGNDSLSEHQQRPRTLYFFSLCNSIIAQRENDRLSRSERGRGDTGPCVFRLSLQC